MTTFDCPTCGHTRQSAHRIAAARLRPALVDRIRRDHPGWDGEETCQACVRRYRIQLLRETLADQRGQLGSLDELVLARMQDHAPIAHTPSEAPSSRGDRVADAVAAFGGSWKFLGLFALVMAAWMSVNIALGAPPDPYPFILLNLVLSCLAAVQAPIIMMSQNRQASRDRAQAEHDYAVNLKAELELQLLHEKLDHLLLGEWQSMLEVQEVQTEMLEELRHTLVHHRGSGLAAPGTD
ncbi:MAG: DUF1003 domain-containing protein [Sandaracinaceae bacterium]